MSNLGNYITITKACKMVGGPEMFVGLVFATGFIGGFVVKVGIEKVKAIKEEYEKEI